MMDIVGEAPMRKIGALLDKKYDKWGYEKIYDSNPPDPTKPQQNQNQNNNQRSGSNGSGGSNNTPKSADWKAGWAQAIADYKAGKLKI